MVRENINDLLNDYYENDGYSLTLEEDNNSRRVRSYDEEQYEEYPYIKNGKVEYL